MKRIAIILCSIFGCFVMSAQPPQTKGDRQGRQFDPKMSEQIKAERVAFFTEKIGLTSDEAQKFWPLYNEMDKKKIDLFGERANIMRRFNHETLTEEETGKQLDRLLAIQQQEHDIAAKYDALFRQILPNSKVIKIYMADFQFRDRLLQKMRAQRKNDRANKHD